MDPRTADASASPEAALAARRRGAVRTAWIVGAIAVGIYVAFVLSGVLNA